MRNRLLALLVFIPMFLVAWYARNASQGASRNTSAVSQDRGESDRLPPEDASPRERDARSERRSSNRASRDRASDQPGAFDFYLLNLSWSPEFCSTHPGKPECAAHPGFVLHGLWPQNNDGSYPQHCSDAPGPADPGSFRDIFPDQGLLQHEWSTHGTCSGLAPDTYLGDARSAFRSVHVPASLANLRETTSSAPGDLLAQFAQANPSFPRESIALSCGNNYLTAVEVCLDRNLHAIACQGVRSCRANSIRIIPPGSTN